VGNERGLSEPQFSVIVAMLAVLTMHVARDDVIYVSGVRNRNVLAADAVDVIDRMWIARVVRIAARQIVFTEFVLVDVIVVRMVEMPVVHVIHVVFMTNREMTAVGTVKVVVAIVNVRFHGRTVSVPRPPSVEQPEQIP
jgi:hypothetical protein